jgi:hypothetical protein
MAHSPAQVNREVVHQGGTSHGLTADDVTRKVKELRKAMDQKVKADAARRRETGAPKSAAGQGGKPEPEPEPKPDQKRGGASASASAPAPAASSAPAPAASSASAPATAAPEGSEGAWSSEQQRALELAMRKSGGGHLGRAGRRHLPHGGGHA